MPKREYKFGKSKPIGDCQECGNNQVAMSTKKRCYQCQSAKNRQYYQDNKDRLKAYYEANKEKIQSRQRNDPKIREYWRSQSKKYVENHKEIIAVKTEIKRLERKLGRLGKKQQEAREERLGERARMKEADLSLSDLDEFEAEDDVSDSPQDESHVIEGGDEAEE